MRTGTDGPTRSESDLRAALASLERHAPDMESVLRAVRDPRRRSRPGPARGPRAPRPGAWPKLVTGVAVAGLAAGLTLALLPDGASSRPRHPGSALPGLPASVAPAVPGRVPSAAAVGEAMLTAFSTASGGVLYTKQFSVSHGVVVDIYQDWSWPAQPVRGQQERWRDLYSGRFSPSSPLKPTEDDGFVYTAPAASANYTEGQLTVVCYAGTGQTGCGYGSTDTRPGTWAVYDRRFVNPGPGLGDLSPAALARGIVKGLWRVTGHSRLNGRQVIGLSETAKGSYLPRPVTLWVDAHSDLPLLMLSGNGPVVTVVEWSYLRPTAANLALLRVPVPAGYPRAG